MQSDNTEACIKSCMIEPTINSLLPGGISSQLVSESPFVITLLGEVMLSVGHDTQLELRHKHIDAAVILFEVVSQDNRVSVPLMVLQRQVCRQGLDCSIRRTFILGGRRPGRLVVEPITDFAVERCAFLILEVVNERFGLYPCCMTLAQSEDGAWLCVVSADGAERQGVVSVEVVEVEG